MRPYSDPLTEAWSFDPGKNPGALRDGRAITTDDAEAAASIPLTMRMSGAALSLPIGLQMPSHFTETVGGICRG